MTLKLTKMEYLYLYLTFPSTITLSLVDIEPHYKRPGMRGFIEINDYENYKIQKKYTHQATHPLMVRSY